MVDNMTQVRGNVGFGSRPEEHSTAAMNNPGAPKKYYWVGVDVVQKKNIRAKTSDGKRELIYDTDPDNWIHPTYLILQKTVTMPPLGDYLYLSDFDAQRLREQMPPTSLITEQEGGVAIAAYIKDQLKDGVTLENLAKGTIGLQRAEPVVDKEKVLAEMDEDEIADLLAKRGLSLGKKKNNT